MHRLPVGAGIGALDPAGMVHEDTHMLERFHFLQRLFQPAQLLRAHLILLCAGVVFWAFGGITFIGVKHEKSRTLVGKPIPQRTKVFLKMRFVFTGRTIPAAPVNIVISRDGKPRHPQIFHDPLVVQRVLQPLLLRTITRHQVPHRHDQVGIKQIRILHRLLQHPQPFGWSARPVAIDQEMKRPLFLGKRQQLLRFPGGVNGFFCRQRCRD